MKLLAFLILICSVFLFIVSCGSNQIKNVSGTLDGAFLEARKQNKYLFVITKNVGCSTCDIVKDRIKDNEKLNRSLSEDYLVYEHNQKNVGGEYLSQIFYSIATPTVYIFKPDGKFITMIAGLASVSHYEDVVDKIADNEYIPNVDDPKLALGGENLVTFCNTMLSSFHILQNKSADKKQIENVLFSLERSLETQSYFFNNYMLAKLYERVGEMNKAKHFATNALRYNKDFDIVLYQPLRNELKYLIDDKFNIQEEAFLQVANSEYNYGVIKLKERAKAVFKIRNVGKKPLIVKNLLGSCNCMKFEWDKLPILPGKEGKIQAIYEADVQGDFSKIIYVFSNSINGYNLLSVKGIVD